MALSKNHVMLSLIVLGTAVPAFLTFQYAPHFLWVTFGVSSVNSAFIDVKPLTAGPTSEEFRLFRLKGVSFELPQTMAESDVFIESGPQGSSILFSDGLRELAFQLPKPASQVVELIPYPEHAELTFPKLYTEVCRSKPTDFSFAMSKKELRWHKFLQNHRRDVLPNTQSVEFRHDRSVHSNLTVLASNAVVVWCTANGKSEGMITLSGAENADIQWMRRVAATLRISGDDLHSHMSKEDVEQAIRFEATK